MLTIDQAKSLEYGDIIYDTQYNNADGTPVRWKVTGKVKTWKRSPNRVRVPLKHGLYDFWEVNENNLDRFTLG